MATSRTFRNLSRCCVVVGWLLSPLAAYSQFVMDVDGLFVEPRIFNGFPNSDLSITTDFPDSAVIDDRDLGSGVSFANRHDMLFSSNGGSSPRLFDTQDSFDISVDLMLDAGANAPRKEAGLRVNRLGFDGLFIVNSDAGEIVAFSDPLPFYSFNENHGISYTTGNPINMRMIYTAPDPDDPEAIPGTIEYLVNYDGDSFTSGPIEFGNDERGIIENSEVGVYAQGGAAGGNPTDFFTATYSNFVFGDGSVADGVDGDYNSDGIVDAADYTVWRDNVGTDAILPNDSIGGTIGEDQYALWKTNFGMSLEGQGAAASLVASVVPEPASATLYLLGAIALLGRRARKC